MQVFAHNLDESNYTNWICWEMRTLSTENLGFKNVTEVKFSETAFWHNIQIILTAEQLNLI